MESAGSVALKYGELLAAELQQHLDWEMCQTGGRARLAYSAKRLVILHSRWGAETTLSLVNCKAQRICLTLSRSTTRFVLLGSGSIRAHRASIRVERPHMPTPARHHLNNVPPWHAPFAHMLTYVQMCTHTHNASCIHTHVDLGNALP